jgi:hypothetical protein
MRIAVVGAGWSGLAAALECAARGAKLTLFEMAPAIGGRARDLNAGDDGLDNGQHICIGAYSETLRLMAAVGVDEGDAFLRLPLRIVDARGLGLRLPPGRAMPAFVRGTLGRRGWSWRDRFALLLTAAGWAKGGFACPPATTVAELAAGLPQAVRQELIEPLCVAFDEAWQHGQRPSLDDFLHLGADLPQQLLLAELLRIELFYRRGAGDQIQATEYQARFPECHSLIERVLATEPQLLSRSDFAPQAQVGRYKIIRELGRGSFAVVYLADDQELGRQVAIKIPGNGHRASSKQLVRLLEEARAAARLRHPGIVAIYDVQPLTDGGVFAVLEYVEGKTLSQVAAADSSYRDIANLFAEIADAVAYAHTRGFVHRDLHPENVVIDDKNAPHVLDFGLAVHEDDQRALAGERAGSLCYMSPEQVRGETHRLDGRADVWAIGVMLYEALTGRRPFTGDAAEQVIDEILQRDPKPLRQIRDEIPIELERICLRCLAKRPEDRFATAGDVANALRATMNPRAWLRWTIGALIVLLLTSVIAVSFLSPYFGMPGAADDSIHVDVLVWRNGRWNGIQQTGNVLPLRDGDQLRIHVQSTRPQYLYVVWIDSQQVPLPVFPWTQGNWQNRSAERLRAHVALPEGAPDEVWPMRVQHAGYEALLLLARPTPLPATIDLAKQLEGLPQLTIDVDLDSGARLDYLRFVQLGGNRALDLKNVDHVTAPIVTFQCALKERLEPLFPEMECLVFPVEQ